MGVSKQESYYLGNFVLDGAFSLTNPPGNGFKVALIDVLGGYVLADFLWERSYDDVKSTEIVSVNYVAGGKALDGPPSLFNISGPPSYGGFNCYCDFPAITADIKYALLYIEGTLDGIVNPLLCTWDLDDTGPANVLSPVAENFNIAWTGNVLAKVSAA